MHSRFDRPLRIPIKKWKADSNRYDNADKKKLPINKSLSRPVLETKYNGVKREENK